VWELYCCGENIVAEKSRIIIAIREQEGWSDLAPMIAPILFGMNSSSSQLLDLLHALKLGHLFFKNPSLASRLPIKKLYSITQAFQTTTTYLRPTKNPRPQRHSRVRAML
jgi:hypothetical protein